MAKREVNRDLPGMEDRAIRPLQNCAREYAGIRDARIELNKQEAKLKKKILRLMHEHEKTHYQYDDVEIELQPPDGEEKVKVKVKKPAEVSERRHASTSEERTVDPNEDESNGDDDNDDGDDAPDENAAEEDPN